MVIWGETWVWLVLSRWEMIEVDYKIEKKKNGTSQNEVIEDVHAC